MKNKVLLREVIDQKYVEVVLSGLKLMIEEESGYSNKDEDYIKKLIASLSSIIDRLRDEE